MSEFSELQARMREATAVGRDSRSSGSSCLAKRSETLELAKANVARGKGQQSDDYRSLVRQQQDTQRAIAAERSRLDEMLIDRDRLLDAFRPFADPRENLSRLPSTHPILLFPVRLETRFKVLPSRDGGAVRHQLWVRIFPDDCSIDYVRRVVDRRAKSHGRGPTGRRSGKPAPRRTMTCDRSSTRNDGARGAR